MWDGHKLPDLASAIFKVIVCPCVFVLGMVLGVLAALRPITAPHETAAPSPGIQFWAVDALGDVVRWLYRRGYFGCTAVLLAVVGLSAVGGAVHVWYRDWDKVVNPHNEALLLFAIIGGLFGLGLLAYAVLLSIASWRTLPTPALSLYQRIHGADIQADPRKRATPLMVIGFFVLAIAVSEFRRGAVSLRTYVCAVVKNRGTRSTIRSL